MQQSKRMAAMAAISLWALGAAMPVAAQQAPTTLTIGVGSPVTSLDPHFHQLGPNNAVADMIFSKLIETDGQARQQPDPREARVRLPRA